MATDAHHPVTHQRAFVSRPVVGQPLLEMRGGVDTTSQAQAPTICAEVQLHRWVSVEGCGTGAGILHQRDMAEMAHFRAEMNIVVAKQGRLEAVVQPGLGFAEVQAGRDQAGFQFGAQVKPEQVEAAGPEASLSGKARMWIHEHAYTSLDISFGAAYIPASPQVMGRGSPLVPFASVTTGIGF